MPFRSARQRRYLYAKHPTIARRWSKKYGNKIQPSKKRKGGSGGRRRYQARDSRGRFA